MIDFVEDTPIDFTPDAPIAFEPDAQTAPSDPYTTGWGYKGIEPVQKGEFQEAFTPPKFVSDALDKLLPSFKPASPELAQLIQMAGLEPSRQVAEEVSKRVKDAVGSVLSPGGVVLAATAPVAPELVGGIVAATSAPGVVEGVKEAAKGVKEGSPATVAGGVTSAALSGLGVVGGAMSAVKPVVSETIGAIERAKAPATAEALREVIDFKPEVSNAEAIRSGEGQLPSERAITEGSKETGGNVLERAPSEQSESVVAGEKAPLTEADKTDIRAELDAELRFEPDAPTGDQPVRIYRGEGGDKMGSVSGGNWFTTDLEKAKTYGSVSYIDTTLRELQSKSAQGHGGPDEYVLSPDFASQAKPLEPLVKIQDANPAEPSIGPGAASPSDFPKEPQIAQLTEAIKGTQPVKQPLTEQAKNQYAAVKQQVIAKTESAVDTLKNFGARALAALNGEHQWTDFKDALGKFSGEQNRTDFALQKFSHEIRRVVPDKLRREAIVNWIQAEGDDAVLSTRAAAARPEFRRGYELAQKLTPDEKVLAENVRSYLDAKLQEGMEAGILKSGVENYITQIWDRPNPVTQKLVGEIFTGKLAPNFRYARKRIFDSYFEGEQAGYKPRIKDVGAIISIYDQAFSKAIASRRLIKSLHEGVAKDGRPLVEVSGVSSLVAESGTPEALLIKPKVKPEELAGYLPIDHPALRGWKWAGTDPETGASILYQGDLLVHPEVHQHLKNVLSSSAFRQNVFTRTALNVGGLLKQSKLALSGFHFTQEGTHALAHRVNPFAPEKIDFGIKDQSALVDHGLQVADYRAYQAFAEGLSGVGSIYEQVPVVGKWLTRYNEYLFQEYIPRLKMTMAMDALERNRARFGNKLSDDQILELTANQANAAFGELNYTMIGRNPTMQDMWRLVLLAPDFLEARGRFALQALTKTGTEQRVALGLQAATLYVAARILNQAVSGDPHWEPKYAFTILANKRQYGLRSVVEDSMHAATDPGQFISNRLAPYARAAMEFVSGRDWRGVKRDFKEQIQDLADWLLPITADKRPETTRVDQALAASGVTVKSATATQRIYDKLKEFKESNKLLTKEEKQEMTAPSEYSVLRRAIMANDESEARKQYEDLLHPTDGTKPKTDRQIRDHFTESVSAPFSGSRRAEKMFSDSLDAKGKALYEEARQERKETAMRLREWQKKWIVERRNSPATPNR